MRSSGTLHVNAWPHEVSPPPAAGPLVVVRVENRRTDTADYEVGAKYNPQWGYEASTIDLRDNASLSDQVTQDAVAILRQQGYRAHGIREAAAETADILVTVRIEVFNVLLILGQDIRLDGLLVMEAVQSRDSRRQADAVGARFELKTSLYPSDAEFQSCFDRLYSTLRDKMRERLIDLTSLSNASAGGTCRRDAMSASSDDARARDGQAGPAIGATGSART